MVTLISLIQDFQKGSTDAAAQILERMAPLAKKYAAKIHCMEHDDALQELYLAILESLNYLDTSQSEGKCVKYIEASVINRYYALCKRYLSLPDTENIDDTSASLPAAPGYDDTLLDIQNFISSLPTAGYKQQIFSLFFYKDLSDKEIAEIFHISRQYVNRVKKNLIRDYFATHKTGP